MNPIGIFGGTFDPIHFGHMRTAFETLQALRLTEIRFVPAGNPPLRESPLAEASLRLAMVRAAIDGQPGFVVDDREVRREGPSYTVLRSPSCAAASRSLAVPDRRMTRSRPAEVAPVAGDLKLAHVVVAHRRDGRASSGPSAR